MFKRMEVAETIYKGVVGPSYEKPTISYDNHHGHIRKVGLVSALSKTHFKMGKCAVKHNQRYMDRPRDRSKLTSLIHFPRYS